VKPDIGSESRFLPTTPAFDAPFRGGGSRRNIAMPFGTEKLDWLGYPMVKKNSTQLNSTQLTTPKEEWINKRKEAKKLIYIPDSLVNSLDVS